MCVTGDLGQEVADNPTLREWTYLLQPLNKAAAICFLDDFVALPQGFRYRFNSERLEACAAYTRLGWTSAFVVCGG